MWHLPSLVVFVEEGAKANSFHGINSSVGEQPHIGHNDHWREQFKSSASLYFTSPYFLWDAFFAEGMPANSLKLLIVVGET